MYICREREREREREPRHLCMSHARSGRSVASHVSEGEQARARGKREQAMAGCGRLWQAVRQAGRQAGRQRQPSCQAAVQPGSQAAYQSGGRSLRPSGGQTGAERHAGRRFLLGAGLEGMAVARRWCTLVWCGWGPLSVAAPYPGSRGMGKITTGAWNVRWIYPTPNPTHLQPLIAYAEHMAEFPCQGAHFGA